MEKIDYSWNLVKQDILSLKNRLGFGNSISFLYLTVDEEGHVSFNNPITSIDEPIDDALLSHQIRTVLYHYSKSKMDNVNNDSRKKFTKISLLDDSMHMSCSTNQHRIEDEFCRLFEKDGDKIKHIFQQFFGARLADKGDLSFEIDLLPLVTALFVYTEGDDGDEFGDKIPSSFNIYFEKGTLLLLPGNYSELRVPEVLEAIFLSLINRMV